MRTLILNTLCFCLCNTVWAQLSTSFTASNTQGCEPFVINFTDNSTSSGTITQWTWKRNGTIVSQSPSPNPSPNLSLLFNTSGQYDVCLIVEDNLGNIDSTCQQITIFEGPTANFTGTNLSGCSPVSSTFTDLSTIGGAGIAQWRWDFGDGTLDTLNQHPTHNYTVIGTLDVTLEVIDSNGCSAFLLRNDYVQVNETPSAGIAHNAFTAICDNTTPVVFNGFGASSTGSLSYTWDLGDNTTQSGQSFSHIYNNYGCYTPTLTVSNGFCAATATTSSCITVAQPSQASFTVSDPVGCEMPHAVSFTSTSSNVVGYSWNFGEKNKPGSTQVNPNHTYTSYQPADSANYSSGMFPVQLAVVDNNGCVDTLLDTVLINNMIVSPTIGALGGCRPVSSNITANSLHSSSFFNSVAWEWDFGNTMTANTQTVSVNYPDTGRYTISLIVTDNAGCKDTSYIPVAVGMPPVIDSIVWSTDTICKPDMVDFEAYGSSYIDSWEWFFSEGSTNTGNPINQNFRDTGYITGILITEFNGCKTITNLADSLYLNVPIAGFVSDYDCSSFTVQFADSSLAPDNWYWDFGVAGINTDTSTLEHPSYTYPDTGSYTVKLIVCNIAANCCDTTYETINLSPVHADFEFQDSVCAPTTAALIIKSTNADENNFNTIAPASIQGNMGVGYSIYAPTGGIYPITLYSKNNRGCVDTIIKNIHIASIDTGWAISSLVGCPTLNVTMADTSVAILSPITSWQWHNGSTTQTITETYATGGRKPIELIVQNSWGCTATLKDTIEVSDLAVFFNANRNVCINSTFTAVATSNGSYTPLKYTWNFGDGSPDTTTLSNIFYHQYDSAGVYDICLTMEDSLGCTRTLCRNNWTTVHDPTVIFEADTTFSSCPPLEVNFTNLTVSGTQWAWNFGDNSVSNLEHPVHVYSTPGFYDVRLTVTAFPGCSNSYTFPQMIEVTGPTGDFNFDIQSGCSPLDVEFTATGANLVSTQWFFGDGNSVINPTTTNDTTYYTYNQPGKYVPILVIDDGLGCQIPIEKDTIRVFGFPTATISADSLICQHDSILFKTNPDTLLGTTLTWYFEGGSPSSSNLPNPLIYYADTGSFDVQLILEKDGCIDTTFYPNYIQVKVAPIAHFGADSVGCAPSNNQFTDSSTTIDGFIQNWSWNFGNGQTDTVQNPSTIFQTVDSFDVKLTVTNNFGCSDSSQQRIYTYPVPLADAGNDSSICLGDTVQLNATGGGNYHWLNAPELSDSMVANPTIILDTSSRYIVEITNSFGCKDYDTTTIFVHPKPNLNLGTTTAICLGDTTMLTATGSFLNYNWTIANTLSCSNCANPLAFPVSSTTYYLEVEDNNNCRTLDSILVSVNPLPMPIVITDTALCQGDSLMLWATGGQNYQWSPNLSISDSSLANPVIYPNDTTTYTVIVSDSNNCSNSANVTVNTQTKPQISITNIPATNCMGDTVQLLVQGASLYNWSPGANLSDSTAANPSLVLTAATNLQVIGQTSAGCSDTSQISLSPLALPLVDAGSLDSLCEGDSIVLQPSTGLSNYQWQSSSSLSCQTCQNPTANPLLNTVYYLEGIGSNGCKNMDSVVIEVLAQATVQLSLADSSLCAGDSTQLSIASSHGFEWLQAPFLADSLSNFTAVYPTDSTWYIVQTTNTCAAQDSIFLMVVPKNFSALTDQSICEGDSVLFDLNTATAISWQGDSLSCYSCPNPVAKPNSSTVYTVSFLTMEGCPITDTATINVNPQATVQLSLADSSLCAGDSTQLSIASSHGFEWLQAPFLADSLSNFTAVYPTDSTWYIVQTTNTCAAQDSIFLMVVPKNFSALTDQSICEGDSVLFDLNTATAISWQGDSLSCYSCPNPVAKPNSSTVYTVSFLTMEGCPIADTARVTVQTTPNIQLSDTDTICLGDSLVLSTQNSLFSNIKWTPTTYLSDSTVANPIAFPVATSTYHVEISNSGCVHQDSIKILVLAGVNINAVGQEGCIGDTVQLLVSGNATNYQWSPNADLDNPNIVNPTTILSKNQRYQVIGERNNCGQDTAWVDVVAYTLPSLQVVSPIQALKGSTVELEIATDINNTIVWTPSGELSCADCPNPSWVASGEQTFQVLVRDDKGCAANDSILLTTFLECIPDLVAVPNAFTPNNDGQNDLLYARSSSVQTIEVFQLYNRWGELVFETSDMQQGWDGRYKGQVLATDVYGYILAFECPATGERLIKKGNVTLIR